MDHRENIVAVAALKVASGNSISEIATVWSLDFPLIVPLELAVELAWADCADKLDRYLKHDDDPVAPEEVDQWRRKVAEWNSYR